MFERVIELYENGLPVRYVGEIHAANYAIYSETFLTIKNAKEHLEDMMFAREGDSMLLFKCEPSESRGEAFERVHEDSGYAYGCLIRGPRGGIRLVRV